MQRKYYDAARKVLEERIKTKQDPLVIQARRIHFSDLCELIAEFEEELDAIYRPTYIAYFKDTNEPNPEYP
jgi:hypothetical protein